MEKLKKHIESIINIYKSGNLSKAEILAEQAIKDNPRVAFLYNLLGLILAEQKKDTQAIKCYEKGISVDPNYGMIYNNLGYIYFRFKSHKDIKKSEQKVDRFALNENIDSLIISADTKTRMLNLSVKDLEIQDEKDVLTKYGSSDSGASLGDILGSVLDKKKDS